MCIKNNLRYSLFMARNTLWFQTGSCLQCNRCKSSITTLFESILKQKQTITIHVIFRKFYFNKSFISRSIYIYEMHDCFWLWTLFLWSSILCDWIDFEEIFQYIHQNNTKHHASNGYGSKVSKRLFDDGFNDKTRAFYFTKSTSKVRSYAFTSEIQWHWTALSFIFADDILTIIDL